MHASNSFAIFHLFLAGAAKARPGNGFQTLNFDRVFAACTNAIVVAIYTLNRIFHRSQLVEFPTFEHEGDFAIARTTVNVQRVSPCDVVASLEGGLLGNLGENSLATLLEVGSYLFKFFFHKIAVLY